jgi:hypothetical protein
MKNKIKINGKIHTIDISDGKGEIPFCMNGACGMRVFIDGKEVSVNGFVEGGRIYLDGKVNFRYERKINFGWYDYWIVDDKNYENLKKIHELTWEEIKEIPKNIRIETALWGLKYQPIRYIYEGEHFGRELTYDDFCICFDKNTIVMFQSSHNGCFAPNYLEMNSKDKDFDKLFKAVKKSIKNYLYL